MSDAKYTRLPTSSVSRTSSRSSSIDSETATHRRHLSNIDPEKERLVLERDEAHAALAADPRFDTPTPAPWKRAALLVFLRSS
jgi:hypothetical protein